MRFIENIKFAGKTYKCGEWTGDAKDIPKAALVGLDTETPIVVPGETPELVLLQVAYPASKVVHLVKWERADEYMYEMLYKNPDIYLAMHNCGFDLDVLYWQDNKKLFNKVKQGHIIDTGARYYLKTLEEGTAGRHYPSLAKVVKQLYKIKLDKDKSIRLTYTRQMEWTEAHYIYGAKDAIATAECITAMPHEYPTERIQVTAVITSYYIQKNGMFVDQKKFNILKKKFTKKEKECLRILEVFGYIPGMEGNKTVLQDILRSIEIRTGIQFERTPKSGDISTSEDKLIGMDIEHPFFKAFKDYNHIHKMLSTYLNEEVLAQDGRVHPFFNPSVRTGRLSCSSPNIQNLPRAEGLRNQYCAPPGKVLLAIDYDQIELCSLAESNYKRFGFSYQGDKINIGIDVHIDMAAQFYEMEYEALKKLYDAKNKEAKDMRQFGKIPNFGTRNPLNLYIYYEAMVEMCKEFRAELKSRN